MIRDVIVTTRVTKQASSFLSPLASFHLGLRFYTHTDTETEKEKKWKLQSSYRRSPSPYSEKELVCFCLSGRRFKWPSKTSGVGVTRATKRSNLVPKSFPGSLSLKVLKLFPLPAFDSVQLRS